MRLALAPLFLFFALSGYMAAFTEPEHRANQWEAACGFTFVLLIIVVFWSYVTSGPRGKHD